METVAASLLKNQKTFVAFARKRLGNIQQAEDVVQDSLLKALKAARRPSADEEMVTWFYRILRRTIIDAYRRQDVKLRALKRFEAELPEQPDKTDVNTLCQCFKRLMPGMPETYRLLLDRIDLQGQSPSDVAAALGISVNNLNVRLHRARKRLKDQLELTCAACSKHGCINCTCATDNRTGS